MKNVSDNKSRSSKGMSTFHGTFLHTILKSLLNLGTPMRSIYGEKNTNSISKSIFQQVENLR